MIRAALFTVVFFFVAPGTNAGLVPWLITGWDRPDVGLGVLDVLGIALVACRSRCRDRVLQPLRHRRIRDACPGRTH